MDFNYKRVAVLAALTMLPLSAFAAAAATGADGGLCAGVFKMLFTCGGGCPG